MSREIKFRGLEKSTGKFVYGGFNTWKHMNEDRYEDIYCIMGQGHESFNTSVTPESVGQYTGLKDKNGVEIYEGDIVLFMDGSITSCESGTECEEFYSKGAVEYCTDEFPHFDVTNRESVDTCDVYGDIEVIGNIHQNPELLKS